MWLALLIVFSFWKMYDDVMVPAVSASDYCGNMAMVLSQ